MDGVLVNAKDWHFEALNTTLVSFGYNPIPYDEHLARYDGLPTRKKLELLAKSQPVPESQFDTINYRKQLLTMELAKAKCVPTDYHVTAVQKLKKNGYRMAVCSNSVRTSVDLLMNKTELMPYFDFTISNEDVTHSKPHPEMYITAMKRLVVSPSEAIVLEDNVLGIKAARDSGAQVMEIKDISQVNYENIISFISEIESR